MFVAAEAFASEVCDGLCTHYKREEDTTMESGKWDEELGRMSEIVGRIKSNSMLLFNESFASTNEREGSEIASQIVGALLDTAREGVLRHPFVPFRAIVLCPKVGAGHFPAGRETARRHATV